MLREKIDQLIMDSRKSGDKDAVLVYQAIKNEFLKFKTAKNADVLDDNAEITIIRKMIKERQQSSEIYSQNGRNDLAEKENFEISLLQKQLPTGPSEDDYNNAIDEYIDSLGVITFDKSHMGRCIKFVKEKLTGADGKKLSELVQKRF